MALRFHARLFSSISSPSSHAGAQLTSKLASNPIALLNDIRSFSKKPQTGATLHDVMNFAKDKSLENLVTRSALWLYGELPIRLARRVVELDRLPYGLCLMPSIRKVREWYASSFSDIRQLPPPRTRADLDQFSHVVKLIYERHGPTLATMSRGVYELRQELSKTMGQKHSDIDLSQYVEVHQSLDDFNMSRVGIRFLIGQHLALWQNLRDGTPHDKDYAGIICLNTKASEVAEQAVQGAKSVCMRTMGTCPQVSIHSRTNFKFPYVPSHLYYMLFELLKNSMRATCEFHADADKLPPIKIVVADGLANEDVAIKVSDEGGGIARSHMPRIWSYMYTTAKTDWWLNHADSAYEDFAGDTPLAGMGYGLPISRVHARYFGGDLQIISMEGFGTDAYLHLSRLGDRAEPLP